MVLLALLGCNALEGIPLLFDGPSAAAILEPSAGPFEEVVGFVANSRSGVILPLDLKEGRVLTDDPTASFLRASAIPTGHGRILGDLAVTGDGSTVTLWTLDQANQELVIAPYITGVEDGHPVEITPVASEVVFVDADGSGDSPSLEGLKVRAGFTPTDSWSVEYGGDGRWWVKGRYSGIQVEVPRAGKAYQSDDGELSFTIEGDATAGDRFDFTTDTGARMLTFGAPLGGIAAYLDRVYVSVLSTPGSIAVLDVATGDLLGNIALAEGAQPTRMSIAPDGRLFVADGALPQAWVVRFDLDPDPATAVVESIPAAASLLDVAWQGGLGADGVAFDHLFVAPVGGSRVDVYDLATSTWVDANPVTEAVEGVFLGSPVSGLAASKGPAWLQREDAWGAVPRIPTVAVATADGYLFQLEGSTGCAVVENRGPHAPNPTYDADSYAALLDQGNTSDSTLWIDDGTGEQVVPSPCGGVTRTETWTITYDSAKLSWDVEGSTSGVQLAAAFDDQRYLSDTGAVSFLIASGARPPTDGDRFVFGMDAGLLVVGGTDEDDDGAIDRAWTFPSRPAAFEYTTGPTGGGWDEVDRRQFVLLPVIDADLVARVHLDAGKAQVDWQ